MSATDQTHFGSESHTASKGVAGFAAKVLMVDGHIRVNDNL
jgi:hypothetical protein